MNEKIQKLTESLIRQSQSEVFYMGLIEAAEKNITREICEILDVDRASIWIYSKDHSSIDLQELYIKAENTHHQNVSLYRKDFEPYFLALEENPIIIADEAKTHPATECFSESYLEPLGIVSMLDVPIWYSGSLLGVICIENLSKKEWAQEESSYAQIMSSLYSFAYSVRQSNILNDQILESQKFLDASSIISIADSRGKITYVNQKFTDVSGYSLEEVVGKDHNIVNSGEHSKEFWADMYRQTVKEKKIWNSVVTNRAKDGSLYYVDTYIRAIFDEDGKLSGFMSIRQDLTELIKGTREIEKKNTYLEHAAKILRHDMHSGINTYIPRGLTSFERRFPVDKQKEFKIDAPIKMIKEGLRHTQKVYKGVYEFTNLVKKDAVLGTSICNLSEILEDYLSATAYRPQVEIHDLGEWAVNEALFCTAIDNLIRNGLKYNDSLSKKVKIYREGDLLLIEDNGRGMTGKEFKHLSQPYTRREGQKESGTGLGLNICIAILEEHGFSIECDKLSSGGTQIQITLK